MRKSPICIGVLWLLGVFIVPLIFTIGNIVSIQNGGIDDAKGDPHEEIVGHKFICTYGGFGRYPDHSYCDQKDFISNLSRYHWSYDILVDLWAIASSIVLLIIAVVIQVYKILKT